MSSACNNVGMTKKERYIYYDKTHVIINIIFFNHNFICLTFYVLGFCFRTLAIILVSDFFLFFFLLQVRACALLQQPYNAISLRSVVVSASDCGFEGHGFESRQ